jgi:hypothetical protein
VAVATNRQTALKITESDEVSPTLPPTPQERRFAEEFFSGENAGNATRSYLLVHPESSYDAASVEASRLLKSPRVRAFLDELHATAIESAAGKLMPWSELLPLAQSVIVATAQGRLRNRIAFEAAVFLTNRVMGTPVSLASTELIVRDEARIAKAVSAFTKRVVAERRREIRALSDP